ncbi:MAG: hypothetical protein K5886_01410 [Lachnospiraceae bacterium]|nr:hypothetical protein [Lachnospiraceae bacterium]
MTDREYVKKTIIYTLIILVLISVTVIIIDPFIRYHKPFFSLAAVETDERSAVIGLARNMDYEVALLGSSMSENFVDSWFEDGHFGDSCVKLPLQGAHQSDYLPVFDEMVKNKKLKSIVFSLDNYLFEDNKEMDPLTIPEYFIKEPGIEDIYYLLNKSVVFNYLPRFLILNETEGHSDDNAYVWADRYQYSKYIARADYMATRRLEPLPEKEYDYYFERIDTLIGDLSKYIEERPDVTFYMYAPPYSILFWDVVSLGGNLTAEICGLSRLYEGLLKYPNVRIFYFQDDYEIICDLDHYRDYSHYDQGVNYRMYEAMKNGDHEVTMDTYYDTLLDMYNFAVEYDYESCFH